MRGIFAGVALALTIWLVGAIALVTFLGCSQASVEARCFRCDAWPNCGPINCHGATEPVADLADVDNSAQHFDGAIVGFSDLAGVDGR